MLPSLRVALLGAALLVQVYAVRVKEHTIDAQKVSNIMLKFAGLWKQRGPLGPLGAFTYYDVVIRDERVAQAFPISGCSGREGSRATQESQSVACDSIIELTVEFEDNRLIVNKARVDASTGEVAPHNFTKTHITDFDAAVNILPWAGEAEWTRDIGELDDFGIKQWDKECRKFGTDDPVQYSMQFGSSSQLTLTHVGFTADTYVVIDGKWLQANVDRLSCILKQAFAAHNNGSRGRFGGFFGRKPEDGIVATAISKLKQVLQSYGGNHTAGTGSTVTDCVPHVSIEFSIPVPLGLAPSISLYLTWPMKFKDCNGIKLREEFEDMKLARKDQIGQPSSDEVRVPMEELWRETEEAGHSVEGEGQHGVCFGVFPLPTKYYFVAGAAALSWMPSNTHWSKLRSILGQRSVSIDELMKQAMAECPEVKRRLDLHGAAIGVSDTEGNLLSIAEKLPELGRGDGRATVSGNAYVEAGLAGFVVGFSGGASRGQQIPFQGCARWKEVVKEWFKAGLAATIG